MYNYNSNILIHNTELSPLGGISLAGTSIQGVGVREKEREVFIIFEGEIFDLWYKQKCFDLSQKVINLTPVEYWRDRFFKACGTDRNDDPNDSMGSVVKLQQILADVHRQRSMIHT